MDVYITYKDTSRSIPDHWIRDVREFSHNSQMRIVALRTEKRTYIINVDLIRHIELAEGEEFSHPTL